MSNIEVYVESKKATVIFLLLILAAFVIPEMIDKLVVTIFAE